MPSLSVTVTVPSLPTVTFASFGRSGFAFLTASSTLPFSSSVKFDGSDTSVTVGLFNFTSCAAATFTLAFTLSVEPSV